MRVTIISDLHANLEALEALPRDYDELWVLGDIVNYGPNPAEAVEWVRRNATILIRGNHDHAIGFGDDCRCSPRFRAMAQATAKFTRSQLSDEQCGFLRHLPMVACRQLGETRFFLCHATPSDPLFEYRPPDSLKWAAQEESSAGAGIVLVGHTHLPFVKSFGSRTVANPGSLGQSKAGDPRARYAIWENGRLELRCLEYRVEVTVKKIEALGLAPEVTRDLIHVLTTGTVP
jgi:protein phosphatase